MAEALSLLTESSPKPVRRLLNFMDYVRETPYDRDNGAQLIAHMIALAPQSKAQLYQDAWAHWTSGKKRGGFFVEFGATDGLFLSNTWLLETQMGWDGILAEPNPSYAEALKANRGCSISTKCVYPTSGITLDFLAANAAEYSRLCAINPEDIHEPARQADSRVVPVETISLNDLLVEH
ncbi:MAG TPA: hypothetical protein VHX64_04460, partial [Caulobacteraceae bacterium]|nr:hypothetical protein [Caulobacteraceae bacterium]